jgi:anti-anti-sigma factor
MTDIADVRFELVDGVRIARLRGEIDASNAWAVSRTLRESVSNQDLRLVVDLTGVRYVDSAGVRILFELRGLLTDHGQELVLIIPPDALIRRTLEVTTLLEAVPTFESQELASGHRPA